MPLTSFDPTNATAPVSVVEGAGFKVGEGTVLHPVFGIETGFDSNVFYTNSADAAGVLRLLGQIGVASLNQSRLNPGSVGAVEDTNEEAGNKGDLQYSASLRVAYDQPLSSSDTITGTGGLGLGATLKGMVNPMGRFSFGFDENFVRMIRASNFETTTNENRDVNNLALSLLYHPPDRSISGYLYYRNVLDVFEKTGTLYPDRMDHRFGIHPMWRLLPQTVLFGDVSMGVVSAVGSSTASETKASSFPLVIRAGISTLLTVKTSVNVSAGYTNGFYSTGPSFSAPLVDAGIAYRYSPLGKVSVGYSLLYVDSVNANFFRDHVIRANISHTVKPFAFMVQPELHFREYNGTTVASTTGATNRDDTLVSIVGGIHYNFRDWIAATLNYKFSLVETDFRYMEMAGEMVNPSYSRHELLLGMRIAM